MNRLFQGGHPVTIGFNGKKSQQPSPPGLDKHFPTQRQLSKRQLQRYAPTAGLFNFVFIHPALERSSADPQRLGGVPHIPLIQAQGFDDHIFFEMGQVIGDRLGEIRFDHRNLGDG